MNVARSAPQKALYQADVIDLRLWLKIKKRAWALWYSRLAYIYTVPDQHVVYPSEQHTVTFFAKCVMPVGQP